MYSYYMGVKSVSNNIVERSKGLTVNLKTRTTYADFIREFLFWSCVSNDTKFVVFQSSNYYIFKKNDSFYEPEKSRLNEMWKPYSKQIFHFFLFISLQS